MNITVFDPQGNSVNKINEVTKVISCKDGRHLVAYNKECKTCKHIENFIYQIPSNYSVLIKTEVGDKIEVTKED